MSHFTPGHSKVLGIGAYIPPDRIPTKDILNQLGADRFGIKPDYLERTMGIKEKRIVLDPEILPSDMAVSAAREALDRAEILAKDIDVVIYTGVVRDYEEPATAAAVQEKVGATNAYFFDMANACHGFMTGVHIVDSLIASGQVKYGLVVTGEQGNRYTRRAIKYLKDHDDKQSFRKYATGLSVGDAGAAVVVGGKLPEDGFRGFMLRSEGAHRDLCRAGKPCEEGPVSADMTALIVHSTRLVVSTFIEFLQRISWSREDVSHVAAHQPGLRLIQLHADELDLPEEKFLDVVSWMGNLISASVPLQLYHLQDKCREGDKILVCAQGSGISVSHSGLIWS